MSQQTLRHEGGSFAPPLTDELIESHATWATRSEPRVKDSMESLLKMVRAWWDLPESTRPGKPHPSHPERAKIVPLEDEHVEELWDLVPWDYELPATMELFDKLEKEAATRNDRKIEAWQDAVRLHVQHKYFPDTGFFEKVVAGLRAAAQLVGLFPVVQAEVDALQKKYDAFVADMGQAFNAKHYDGIPYPVLEPTPHRNAAHHLLWFAGELTLDREPITADKLA